MYLFETLSGPFPVPNQILGVFDVDLMNAPTLGNEPVTSQLLGRQHIHLATGRSQIRSQLWERSPLKSPSTGLGPGNEGITNK